jgi:ABC-type enterochelin transport system ATPase subunit
VAKKKRVIKVTYTFDVEYEHEDHLKCIKRDLQKAPVVNMQGAGVAGGDTVYSFKCRMRDKGKIEKNGKNICTGTIPR